MPDKSVMISRETFGADNRLREWIGKQERDRGWSSMGLFGASTFLFWAALYVYVPILPTYAESLGAGLSMVGAIVASYAIAQLLLRAPLGVLADILGRRKPFIVSGLLFTSVGALVMAMAPDPWLLFAGRAITGVAAATWVISSVFFASYFPPEKSARGIGIVSVLNSTAMVAATSMGGFLAGYLGAHAVFFIGAVLGVIGALFLMPVPEPKSRRTHTGGSYLAAATQRVVLMASLISVLVHFASAATISSFTLVYAARLGASPGELGLLSGVYLASATLATLGAIYVVERWGYSHTIILGAAIMGTTLLASPLVTALLLFGILQILTGAGRGLVNMALMALSISEVEPAQRATAMGVYQAIYAAGMLAGPIVAGMAAESMGIGSVFYISGGIVLMAGGLATLRITA